MALTSDAVEALENIVGIISLGNRKRVQVEINLLIRELGGEPADFAYLMQRRTDWHKSEDGDDFYLVQFEDDEVHTGDADFYIVPEPEVAELVGLAMSSLKVMISGNKFIRRPTTLGMAVIAKSRGQIPYDVRGRGKTLDDRRQRIKPISKKSTQRSY